jgi:hypothetical protein
MKLDQEKLQKHRFWILLGLFVPLVLFTLIWLSSSVARDVRNEKRKVEELKKQLVGEQQLRETQSELKALTEQEQKLEERKKEVWKQAYEIQKDLDVWPHALMPLRELYFGDRIPETDRDEYTRSYAAEYEELVYHSYPIQFNGGWRRALQVVQNWDVQKFGIPSDEEVWLAQEDYWVQRDLLLALQEANSFVSRFKKAEFVDSNELPKFPGEKARQRFVNPNWQVDVFLVQRPDKKSAIRARIKNIGRERQLLGRVFFRVWVTDDLSAPPEELAVQGEALAVGQTAELMFVEDQTRGPEKVVVNAFEATGLFAFEQVLDVAVAPVKRVEKIAIPYHSNRTYEPDLKPARFSTAKPTPEKKDAGFSPLVTAVPGKDKDARTLAHYKSNKTDNGVERLRYLAVSPEVRRLPIAMTLIVDEAHIQDVLTALTNSKLRLQITQVDWHRYRQPVRTEGEQVTTTKGKAGTPPPPPGKAPPPPPRPGTQPGKPAAADKTASEDQPFSLVELAVYALASLYERYPPRHESAEPTEKPKEPKEPKEPKDKPADAKPKSAIPPPPPPGPPKK